jgi:hypothetical protein
MHLIVGITRGHIWNVLKPVARGFLLALKGEIVQERKRGGLRVDGIGRPPITAEHIFQAGWHKLQADHSTNIPAVYHVGRRGVSSHDRADLLREFVLGSVSGEEVRTNRFGFPS